jgi:hypothetical protein
MIKSALQSPLQGGCYVMSDAAYTTHGSYVGALLQGAYGRGTPSVQTGDWENTEDIDLAQFSPMPIFMSCSFNFGERNMIGKLDKQARRDLEQYLVTDILSAVGGEEGKYHSLTEGHDDYRTKQEYQQMMAAEMAALNFRPDPMLVSSGLAADWPIGRGTYVHPNFVAWIGEQDHLRVIVRDTVSLLNPLLLKLKEAVEKISEALEAQSWSIRTSSEFGRLTSNVQLAGNGFCVSALVPAPGLTNRSSQARAARQELMTLKGCSIQVRKQNAFVSFSRFGLSEKEVCIDFADAMQALKHKDDSLAAEAAKQSETKASGVVNAFRLSSERKKEKEVNMASAAMKLMNRRRLQVAAAEARELILIGKIKLKYPNNIAIKHFDKEYYDTLPESDQRRFMQILKPGLDNPDRVVGCYARNSLDYATFEPYFSKVLAEFHQVNEDTKQSSEWDLGSLALDFKQQAIREGKESVKCVLQASRNLDGFPMGGGMTLAERVAVEDLIWRAIEASELSGSYISLTPNHSQFGDPYERYAGDPDMMFKQPGEADLGKNWPHGRGCWISDSSDLRIFVGGADHLCISIWKDASEVSRDLLQPLQIALQTLSSAGLSYSTHAKFGVLTTSPLLVGTGMLAGCYDDQQYEGLVEEKARSDLEPLGVSLVKIEQNNPYGWRVRARLGTTEAQFATAFYNATGVLKTN